MKIVLAEDRSGQLHGEHSFTSDVIRVGRDPAVCHYFFPQEQWPMVSRKHAEFRLSEGRYLIADANSRFGTFVNGQRITDPVEVRVGSQVQLGTGGPILRVISIEQAPLSRPGDTARAGWEYSSSAAPVSADDPVHSKNANSSANGAQAGASEN